MQVAVANQRLHTERIAERRCLCPLAGKTQPMPTFLPDSDCVSRKYSTHTTNIRLREHLAGGEACFSQARASSTVGLSAISRRLQRAKCRTDARITSAPGTCSSSGREEDSGEGRPCVTFGENDLLFAKCLLDIGHFGRRACLYHLVQSAIPLFNLVNWGARRSCKCP